MRSIAVPLELTVRLVDGAEAVDMTCLVAMAKVGQASIN
jgi:hypothetical protein